MFVLTELVSLTEAVATLNDSASLKREFGPLAIITGWQILPELVSDSYNRMPRPLRYRVLLQVEKQRPGARGVFKPDRV